MTRQAPSLFDWAIVGPAIRGSLRKLDPRLMVRNPVMCVTMVGAVVTTAALFTTPQDHLFIAQLALWLWFTVWFGNLAEAVAEGQGKAQAQSLCRARKETIARRIGRAGEERVPAPQLQGNGRTLAEWVTTAPEMGA